jgi:hypothetical protein
MILYIIILCTLKTPWPESASELYRPRDRRLSAKLVLTFADRGCHVVSVTDPNGRIYYTSIYYCCYCSCVDGTFMVSLCLAQRHYNTIFRLFLHLYGKAAGLRATCLKS